MIKKATATLSQDWFETIVWARPNPASGIMEAFFRGLKKDGNPFAVAQDENGPQETWVHVHISTGRIAPVEFNNQQDAILAAERLAPIGDWESALQDWVKKGLQVPFRAEAIRTVTACGGEYLGVPPDRPEGSLLH